MSPANPKRPAGISACGSRAGAWHVGSFLLKIWPAWLLGHRALWLRAFGLSHLREVLASVRSLPKVSPQLKVPRKGWESMAGLLGLVFGVMCSDWLLGS